MGCKTSVGPKMLNDDDKINICATRSVTIYVYNLKRFDQI